MKEPLKWKKYRLLVHFGLISDEQLQSQIHRFRTENVHDVFKHLRSSFAKDISLKQTCLYVIKIVSPMATGQLPNHRVHSGQNVEEIECNVLLQIRPPVTEIWVCRTDVDTSSFSVAGRICFDAAAPHQIVEQVWRCSPRLIEQIGGRKDITFIRGSRMGWGRHFHIGAINNNDGNTCHEVILKEFHQTMQIIERERSAITEFCKLIESHGLRNYSLEYKVVNSKLSIIDWDTENDLKLLRSADYHLLSL